jgi:hypothetical protein
VTSSKLFFILGAAFLGLIAGALIGNLFVTEFSFDLCRSSFGCLLAHKLFIPPVGAVIGVVTAVVLARRYISSRR